jgi:haloacetate dehalogenase
MSMFDGFESLTIDVGETTIFVRRAGSSDGVLLLHGFPETHLMWRGIAPALAREFSVVCADLRGYGASGAPPSAPDHELYGKRAMARDLVNVMDALGLHTFAVAGHDRGARVAYRMALDHPDRVVRLAVLDIVPTLDAVERADVRLALSFWPWSLLAQPAPLPERLIDGDPEVVLLDAMTQWGTAPESFGPEVRSAYVDVLRDAAHVHAMCEEYRAAATLDVDHDRADRIAGRRIALRPPSRNAFFA